MKIIQQSARILTPEDGMQALRQIEQAGRNCYRSEGKITEDSAPRFVAALLKRGHLSPVEFADMSVEQVTSRDVMAELTRHRLVSFCIESQRYVNMNGEIAFIQPMFYREGSWASGLWWKCMEDAEKIYHDMLAHGIKPEDARKVQPNSTAVRIIMKANLREWLHIFTLRTDPAAYPEMRTQMALLLRQARERIPLIFDGITIPDGKDENHEN